jgi:nitrogen regulatory protein P-II 2
MKIITAIIKPFVLDGVRESLSAIGASGITVTYMNGVGRQKGHRAAYRGAPHVADYVSKVKIETIVADSIVDLAVKAIERSAAAGKVDDGAILVTSVERIVRVRTGETGANAC